MNRYGIYRHFGWNDARWEPCATCTFAKVLMDSEDDNVVVIYYDSNDAYRFTLDEFDAKVGTEFQRAHPEHVLLPDGI